ncbi:MAG: bifunctional phosphoribosylaminoimidazolecarboxamide formyltransferase/IMP cyclohydrolase [Firmicutes bacterium]|nr:bifunctional phosphoribosylaminoimidazolecarboxamide formyltransferase/IMP cyclohydrolase [Bacillota bacterium]
MIARALVSVYDKTGLVKFARGLADLGIELISTGGTARALSEAGIRVKQVSEETGFPEILGGRVKTLHPKIHGGLLAVRDDPEHLRELAEAGISPLDMVVVNLYPFKEVASSGRASLRDVIENIDIGGPTMLRSAAKNYANVLAVCDPADYDPVLAEIRGGRVSDDTRLRLAVKAFSHTAHYDALVSCYLGRLAGVGPLDFPAELTLPFERVRAMRYGENPHQVAAFYREPFTQGPCVSSAEQLQGKDLSYNNVGDADTALKLVAEFEAPAAAAIKHANPCGVGVADTPAEAFARAYESDPVSIFGGIIGMNRVVDVETARLLAPVFLEVVIAPGYDEGALDILRRKKDLRLLATGEPPPTPRPTRAYDLRKVGGGLLVQEADSAVDDPGGWRCVTHRAPSPDEMRDLVFGWKVCKHVKSNAIVIARSLRTVGIGAGQMSRIGAARIAIGAAGDRARGAVMASDAFFPFPDVVEEAARAGIAAVVQPGGSVRDDESISAADRAGMAMMFTGVRHFRH